MKFNISKLKKNSNKPLDIDEELDLSYLIENSDIKKIESTNVKGNVLFDPEKGRFSFNLNICSILYLECAHTLELVKVDIDFNRKYLFSIFESDIENDVIKVENNFIEFDQFIFGDILITMPMKVYSENYNENQFNKTSVKPRNTAFKDLENYFEKK